MGFLEAPSDQKINYLNEMTKEEIDYAVYIEDYFRQALAYLVASESLGNGIENYFVHMRQGFVENVKEQGLIDAFKNILKHLKRR